MIDQLLGRPSAPWKRSQVALVLAFWYLYLAKGPKNGPGFLSNRFTKRLKLLTPWQLIIGALTGVYTLRNIHAILGLSAPEPHQRLYSRDFYRATWFITAMDAGFATAMNIRIKWIRDLASVVFTLYYTIYANEADEKLRKYRALSTVEFLRATWEKTSNPYLRFLTTFDRPRITIKRKLVLQRPKGSPYTKGITAWLFYNGTDSALARCKDLILDFSGGGFICMSPLHHEERIIRWAKRTGKPILSVDYCKAPEFPYPFAIHEGLDVYRLLVESRGRVIGFASNHINIVMSGDSAGANIVAAVVLKLLEMPSMIRPPLPISLVFAYAALDFNFSSWMTPSHVQVLRHESMANLKGIADQKDHYSHRSPLAIQNDRPRRTRRKSWSKSFAKLPFVGSSSKSEGSRTPRSSSLDGRFPDTSLGRPSMTKSVTSPMLVMQSPDSTDEESDDPSQLKDEEKSIGNRVQYWENDAKPDQLQTLNQPRKSHMSTRLTMTSRSACFNDRILSAPMMRSMALCYIGPRNSPDISTNYYISPILAPDHLLAFFPPVFLICGEKDPLSDDTIVFAGRLRDAKNARKQEALDRKPTKSSQVDYDPIVDESEEDWVSMRIIEGWSHGFLQMVTLLRAAEEPIAMMADFIQDSFHVCHLKAQARIRVQLAEAEKEEFEPEVLSFETKRRPAKARVASPMPISSSSTSLATDLSTSTSASSLLTPLPLQDLQTKHIEEILKNEDRLRRTSAAKHAPFVDASEILQRRRDDVVFGLKESTISLGALDEDLKGQEAAKELSDYAA